jgi:hypothetical protein
MPAYDEPIRAQAFDGEVVLRGPGPVRGAFEPTAILACVDELRAAAEEALRQRRTPD